MKPTDILPAKEWAEIEKEFAQKADLTPAVFDAEGARVTDTALWCNRLCPAVRKQPKVLSQVCALAHQNMAQMARNSRKPVVEECDAGMLKIVVPIFANDEFVGAIGGCGRLLPDSQVEEEYLAELSGIPTEEIHTLAGSVNAVSGEEARTLANLLAERVRQILNRP